MQIRPLETFPVLYQISDPSDANTYYVRSVIRNSATGAIIRIKNLNYVNLIVDSGNSRRFSANIQAPSDQNGGQGTWIDVTTSVYTDAAYTVKSTLYQENIDKYLVQERWGVSWAGGGGSGYGSKEDLIKALKEVIDYERIGGKVKEHIDPLHSRIPEYKDRTDEVLATSSEIQRSIRNIKLADPVDLTPHTKAIIRAIKEAVGGIHIPEVDLAPLHEKISAIKIPDHPDYAPAFKDVKETLLGALGEIKKAIPSESYIGMMDELSSRIVGRTEKEDPQLNRVKNLLK